MGASARVARIADWPARPDFHDDLGGVRVARGRFHLGFRLGASRVYEWLAPEHAVGRWPSRRSRLAASLVTDGLWAVALSRSRRSLLWPRAVTDAIDQVAWGVPAVKLDHTMAPGVPLTVDAVTDLGAAGFAVPVLNWAVVAGARRRRGLDTPADSMLWQVTAGLIALTLRRYARQQDLAQRRRHQVELRARASAAYVSGQNEVAAGADNIVDLLARTEPLVAALETERPVRGSGTARALHTWKAQLADDTRREGAYLAALLVQVARGRQTRELAADVVYELAAEHRALVLSAQQARWLAARLAGDEQVGTIPVTVASRDHRAGHALELAVGAVTFLVPPDPDLDVRVVDVAPVVALAGGLWCAVSALPVRERVAWWAVAPAALAAGVLATLVHRGRVAGEPWSSDRVVTAMLAAQALYAPLAAATMRNRHDAAGLQQFPQLGGFLMAAPALLGLDDPALTDPVRARLAVLAAAVTLPGFVAARQRVDARHLLAAAVLPVSGWVSARGVSRGLQEHRETLAATLEAESGEVQAAAHAVGRSEVVDLVRIAAVELRARTARVQSREFALTAEERELLGEAQRRVEEALAALADLGARSTGAVRAPGAGMVDLEE